MNSDDLTVAGIMPLYNQRATVREAVESALQQTRPIDELVIVDDGSSDGGGELVLEHYGHDRRVRLLRQANRGAGAARNTAIRASRCRLLAFLDADDRWLPQRIEKGLAVMAAKPACMLLFSAAFLGDEIHNVTTVEGASIDKETYLQKAFFREDLLPACDGVMVRREVFDAVDYFDESLRKCQDTDMWLRIMVRYGFEHIPEPLVWVRRGPHRTMTDSSLGFPWQEQYYRKHRYTFGSGLRGRAIWRAGYGAALRSHAIWYFRHAQGRRATEELVRALCVWPLFDPAWVIKAGLEYLLGTRVYHGVVGRLKTALRRARPVGARRQRTSAGAAEEQRPAKEAAVPRRTIASGAKSTEKFEAVQ